MPRIKISPDSGATLEIQCEPNGPIHTFMGGQIADINVPMEFARVANIPGCKIVDEQVERPKKPYTPKSMRPRYR